MWTEGVTLAASVSIAGRNRIGMGGLKIDEILNGEPSVVSVLLSERTNVCFARHPVWQTIIPVRPRVDRLSCLVAGTKSYILQDVKRICEHGLTVIQSGIRTRRALTNAYCSWRN